MPPLRRTWIAGTVVPVRFTLQLVNLHIDRLKRLRNHRIVTLREAIFVRRSNLGTQQLPPGRVPCLPYLRRCAPNFRVNSTHEVHLYAA